MTWECAAGTLIMGRGNILWKRNDLGMCRGNTNNGTREPHPVWGFKNLKAERCGAKGLGRKVNGRRKLSIVFKRSLQVGCSRNVALQRVSREGRGEGEKQGRFSFGLMRPFPLCLGAAFANVFFHFGQELRGRSLQQGSPS